MNYWERFDGCNAKFYINLCKNNLILKVRFLETRYVLVEEGPTGTH